MSNKLIEAMVGIETYRIPQHHGHILINVTLEHFDNIIAYRRVSPNKDNNKMFFNSVNFAESLILGFIPSVQCFFVPIEDVLYAGLEYHNLKLARNSLITSTFIDRCLAEANDVFKLSEEPINRINAEIERMDWENRISQKIYCIYQLDSLLKMINDKDLPGDPIDFLKIPDTKYMNEYIDSVMKEILEIRKTHKNCLDEQFIYRTLHSEYINIFYSKSFK